MKRRNFLASLLGLAAAPALAKVELLVPPAPVSPAWRVGPTAIPSSQHLSPTVYDLRAEAQSSLAKWFGEQMDAAMFAALTKDGPA